MYRVGIDLGGTNISVGIVDPQYRIISRHSVTTRAKRPAREVVADICAAVDKALSAAGLAAEDCESVGIGAPGICDVKRGTVVRSYSLAWENVPLRDMLSERWNLPVRVENDANCAALAEVRAGAAVGCENAVLVTLGTGIGTGIIIGGKIYSGLNGSGTEMGHITLDYKGELCTCGRRGCWDAYASATALIAQAKRAAASRAESALNLLPELTGKSIFATAAAGDVTANAVIDEYCCYLAFGICNIVNALAPECILVGGGISRQGDRILEPVRRYIRKRCFDKREEAMPAVLQAQMGNDAGIVGAAVL